MEFKVGDKVKVVSYRRDHWNEMGRMDKYMGKVHTITEFNGVHTYHIDQDPDDHRVWLWRASDFTLVEEEPTTYITLTALEEKLAIYLREYCISNPIDIPGFISYLKDGDTL